MERTWQNPNTRAIIIYSFKYIHNHSPNLNNIHKMQKDNQNQKYLKKHKF